MPQVVSQLLASNLLQKIVVFKAEMGVGKTTLIKEFTKQLGLENNSSSPTFSLVNEYHTSNGEVLYHFDLYRLNSEIEALDMGIEEYFYSGNWCFIEWPEKTPNLIPSAHSEIAIEVLQNGNRLLKIN